MNNLITTQFMEIFDFTADELTANRQGFIPKSQQRKLRYNFYTQSKNELLLLIILVGFLSLAFIVNTTSADMSVSNGLQVLVFFWLIFAFFVIIFGKLAEKRMEDDIQNDAIVQKTGYLLIIQREQNKNRGYSIHLDKQEFAVYKYYLCIGKDEFHISNQMYHQLNQYEDEYCTLYFTQRSRKILSMEIVAKM